MGTAKNQTCMECNEPGSLNTHPDCKRARHARTERERKAALRATGVKSSDLNRISRARKLGISVEALEVLMSAPCDVCGGSDRNSAYDRKDTGAVVGTLCQRCVSALSFLGHDPQRAKAALALLTSDVDQRTTTSERS